jgi:ankyrin repeat protein
MDINASLCHLAHSKIVRIAAVLQIVLACSISAFCGPIHDASYNGDLKKVKALIENKPKLVFSKDKYGYTPLHWAAMEGHKDVAELLLANRAEINATSNKRRTPVIAEVNGRKVIGEILKNQGFAPLHEAVLNGHKDVVELLLAKGADVNIKDASGFAALHWAAQNRNGKNTAELLLANKADVNTKDKNDFTPLHYAAEHGLTTVVELLLNYGADVTH